MSLSWETHHVRPTACLHTEPGTRRSRHASQQQGRRQPGARSSRREAASLRQHARASATARVALVAQKTRSHLEMWIERAIAIQQKRHTQQGQAPAARLRVSRRAFRMLKIFEFSSTYTQTFFYDTRHRGWVVRRWAASLHDLCSEYRARTWNCYRLQQSLTQPLVNDGVCPQPPGLVDCRRIDRERGGYQISTTPAASGAIVPWT